MIMTIRDLTSALLQNDKTLFSIGEAAKILNISESVLRFWMSNNNMIFYNIGGCWEPYATYVKRGLLTYQSVGNLPYKTPKITCSGLYAIYNMRSDSVSWQMPGAMNLGKACR